MTAKPIASLLIASEQNTIKAGDIACQISQHLSFELPDQERTVNTILHIARLMLMFENQGSINISQIQLNGRVGIRISCEGNWLRLLQLSSLWEQLVAEHHVDEVHFGMGNPPSLIVTIWKAQDRSELPHRNAEPRSLIEDLILRLPIHPAMMRNAHEK